jgi:hypothetical protein
MHRIIENDLSLTLKIDYKFKADLNGFFARHTFYPSSTCVPNIKAVLFNLTELWTGREEVVMRNSGIREKANAICPPTFSGVGIKISDTLLIACGIKKSILFRFEKYKIQFLMGVSSKIRFKDLKSVF